LNLYTPKRRELLNSILRSFGVKLGGEHALEVEVDEDSFIRGKHNLIQAILHVNNLFMLASSTVQGIFYEDVRSWLDEYRIRYIEGVKFTGKSSFEHRLDFAIPRSEGAPERYLRVINTVNKQNVSNFIFTWEDIKEGRPPNAKAYAFLNDTQKRINPSLKIALSKYEIIPVLWSEKEEVLAEIAA
ncbi:MAG: DUF1829 domain-containing protein, partial [Bacteroidia bacterium]|nr:DUF1829 domain-containing protein [Bacteroidia bacterium]